MLEAFSSPRAFLGVGYRARLSLSIVRVAMVFSPNNFARLFSEPACARKGTVASAAMSEPDGHKAYGPSSPRGKEQLTYSCDAQRFEATSEFGGNPPPGLDPRSTAY